MLTTMTDEERAAFILMEKIQPSSQSVQFVRGGHLTEVIFSTFPYDLQVNFFM